MAPPPNQLEPLLPVLAPLVAIIGACIGSFANVVAWRLPRQESLVHPPSHCPRCGTRLAWHENVPVFGWLRLGGRCGHCHQPIAIRYPLVEVLAAGLWVAVLLGAPLAMGPHPHPSLLLIAGWLLASWLLPMALIDLDRLWLPEPMLRWGVLLGLVVTGVLGFQQDPGTGRRLLLDHLMATAMGLLGFELVSALAQRAFGRPALGLGDAKLAALMGAWLGSAGLGVAVILSVFLGAAFGVAGRISGRLARHQAFPFGPFLALGTIAVWCTGPGIWLRWLLGASFPFPAA